MSWEKQKLILSDGTEVLAQAPVIISASRATDIPAFYGDWLVDNIKKGYVKWKNPFNGVSSYITFAHTRLFVFWTKNPAPFLKHLSFFNEQFPNYYFQFTLNDYEREGFEPGLPSLEKRIETFIRLADTIGKERVIWRFDPLILTDKLTVNALLDKIDKLGNRLHTYTEKLVFSFADIGTYRKVKTRFDKKAISYQKFEAGTMTDLAAGLQQLNQQWGLELATCGELIDLDPYGIQHNKCIDDDLIIRLFHQDKQLMEFLKVEITPATLFAPMQIKKYRNNKDRGQRKACGCIISKDIGSYNTCSYGCIYCYAGTFGKKNK